MAKSTNYIISALLLLIGLLLWLFNKSTIAITFLLIGVIGLILKSLFPRKESQIGSKEFAKEWTIYITILAILQWIINYIMFKRKLDILCIFVALGFIALFYLYFRFFVPKALKNSSKSKISLSETIYITILVLLMLGMLVLTMVIILKVLFNKSVSYWLLIIEVVIIALLFGIIYFVNKHKRKKQNGKK